MTIECNDGEMYNKMDNSAGKPIYCRIARWEVQSMADKTVILQRIGNNSSFTRSDMQAVIEECGYNTSESITNHMITRMLAAGDIVRIGRNRYCVSGFQKTYQFPHSEFAVAVADEIVDAHPYLEFRVFELVQLNEFVNHQMAHNIVFVSVEGGLEEDVFNTLWEKHKGAILLKPNVDELFRYISENMVVIVKLPSESPKGISVFWDTRLEKMLVDIAVDKLLRKVVYSGEYPAIYHDALSKYVVDKSVMVRYARRRGALKKYRDFLVKEAGIKQGDFEI